MRHRVAAIDIGTNTVLLFIGEVTDACTVCPLFEAIRFARLGEGVDASGRLTPEAIERAGRILKEYAAMAAEWKVSCIVAGATSATRDAVNREAFLEAMARLTGIRPEVLSGEEEAIWSYRGALAHPDLETLQGPVHVMDIGGGSTECVWGHRQLPVCTSPVVQRVSLNIGAVRIRERFFTTVPPSEADWKQAVAFVEERLSSLLPEPIGGATFIGAAGTIAALYLLDSQHPVDNITYLPVGELTYERVRYWLERIRWLSPEEVLALRPEVLRGREDVFAAGVLILERWMALSGHAACLVSPWGLRQGLALRVVWTGRCGHPAEEDTPRTSGI